MKRHLGISYNSNMQKACEFNNVKNLKNENHVTMHGSQTVDKSLTLEIRYRAFSMRKNVVKH